MFRADELPERSAVSPTLWGGTYRGRVVKAERGGTSGRSPWRIYWGDIYVTAHKDLPEALWILKCWADWEMWWGRIRGTVDGTNANVSRKVITSRSATYGLDDWGYIALREEADQWLKEDAGSHAYAWWRGLTLTEQTDFARDAWLCSHGFRREREAWEDLATPGERPLTAAEQHARYEAEKKKRAPKKKKRKAAARPKRAEPELLPERQFGVCRKCHVCLAFDVNRGCCTACGGRLTPNPRLRYQPLPHGFRKGIKGLGAPTSAEAEYRGMALLAHLDAAGQWWAKAPEYDEDYLAVAGSPEAAFDAIVSVLDEEIPPRHKMNPANPQGREMNSPTHRFQLFVPGRHGEGGGWTGLPKRLSRRAGRELSNKPGGAFWTSSLGEYDDEPSSDWNQWMRWNMPQWAFPTGVVLEVEPDANVKHLTTKREAQDFLDEYGVDGGMGNLGLGSLSPADGQWSGLFEVVPDWKRVWADFDGLHVEGDALSHPAFYGWDAESTAWFSTKPLTVVEEVSLSAPPEEEENPRPRRKRKRKENGRLTRKENARLFRKLMRL